MKQFDLFSIDFKVMEQMYNDALSTKASSEAKHAQSEQCYANQCDHPRFKRDGSPAIKNDGEPDRRYPCGQADEFFKSAQSDWYAYGCVDLLDFFAKIGLGDDK